MTDNHLPPKRKPGRPVGSKDSYKRFRTASKLPKPTTMYDLMPTIRELVAIAELNGYHKQFGAPNKKTQAGVDRAVTRLVAAIQMVVKD